MQKAKKLPQVIENHGDRIVDNYEWLRDRNSADTTAFLEGEKLYAEQATAHLASKRQELFEEIKGHVKENNRSLPVRYNDWWYYTRTLEGKSYPYYCRVRVENDSWIPPKLPEDGSPAAGEQLIYDANAAAEGQPFFSLGTFTVSNDGNFLLYGVDNLGDERYTLRVKNLSTGEDLPDVVTDTNSGAHFHPDGRSFFYQSFDETWRPDKLWQHRLGTEQAQDKLIFHEPEFWLSSGISNSERLLVISTGNSDTSASWVVDLAASEQATTAHLNTAVAEAELTPRLVWPRQERVRYEVEHAVVNGQDLLLINHNREAVDFELVAADFDNPQNYRVIIPHRQGVQLDGIEAFSTHWALSYRQDGLPRVALAKLPSDNTRHSADASANDSTSGDNAGADQLAELSWEEITFDDEVRSVESGHNEAWECPYYQFTLETFVIPEITYLYKVDSGEKIFIDQAPVLNYQPENYGCDRIWVTAEDGTKVPASVIYRKDMLQPDAPQPCLLYGYGSYGASIDPGFSVARLPLLDRGLLYVVAHIRGGGEMGETWYQAAKYANKPRTFTDFIAVAKALISQGRTTADQLVIEGRSAGGMLIGNTVNLAPELFKAAVAGVPFVDVLTTMLKPELPLTVMEYHEWGNPTDDPEAYRWIKGYSPYHNIAKKAEHYPDILAITGLNDPRVSYTEPAKWVSKLREHGARATLYLDESCGHFGSSDRYDYWRSLAWQIAWVLDRLGR